MELDPIRAEGQITELEREALESYRKGVAEPPTIWRDAGYFKAADEKNTLLTFVASEESPDRFGDVITAEGWDLANFKRNPVFMMGHDYSQPPLGTVPNIRVEGKQLLAGVKFDVDDPMAATVAGKYQRGVMSAVSVGFRALEFEEVETDKTARSHRRSLRFTKAELLELSAVAVPAHPAALIKRALYAYPKRVFLWMPQVEASTTMDATTTTASGVAIKVQADVRPEVPDPAPDGLGPADVETLRDAIRKFKE